MSQRRHVLVVGDGLAGSAAAAALARHGWYVSIVADGAACAASNVPAAVMAPRVGLPGDPLTRLRQRGLEVTEGWLQRLERAGHDPGRVARRTLLLPGNERERARYQQVGPDEPHVHRLPAEAIRQQFGLGQSEAGLLHTRGGSVRPDRLARSLRDHGATRIETLSARVERLQPLAEGWVARDRNGNTLTRADHVLLAAGVDCLRLWPATRHWLLPARGQATAFATTPATARLTVAVSGGGYLTPPVDGLHWCGATIQRGDLDTQPRVVDDETNLGFAQRLAGFEGPPRAVDRFVGVRATTPSRLPLVGALADRLWISAGHGAHGLLTACLAGVLLASTLAGRSHPSERLLAPGRRRDRAG